MVELCIADCEDVGGGVVPVLVGAILGITTMLNNSGTLYDFFSGVLDGFNDIR